MAINITAGVTGGTQTGFTTPGYTMTADKGPDINANQSIVSAVSGTQTGVRVHTVSDPFSISVWKPKNIRVLPSPNPVTGKYPPLPSNRYMVIVRKGANFAANNAPAIATIRMYFDIPAGTDAYDAANIRAAVSMLVGTLSADSAGLGDTLVSGVL